MTEYMIDYTKNQQMMQFGKIEKQEMLFFVIQSIAPNNITKGLSKNESPNAKEKAQTIVLLCTHRGE